MKKRVLSLLLAFALCVGVPSLADASEDGSLKARAQSILCEMSAEQKIGQVLLVNFRKWKGTGEESATDMDVLNGEVSAIIQKYHLGNIILFGENTKTTEGCARLTAALQKTSREGGDIPLLIGIDQEGGTVTRLGQGTCMPGNMALGAAGDTGYAYLAGNVIGKELFSLGVNCDFAPDSDVNDNPANPIIGLRSFGSDAGNVANMARSYLNGLNDADVIGCAKHFPGHGNTDTDTHTGLAIVNKTKDEWLKTEAVPFKALIDAGIDMIMSAHIQYPNLDSAQVVSKSSGGKIYLPATLSRAVLTDLLKNELGFGGVICTDAMDMQAITDNFGETDAVIMALNAGADLICNPTKLESAEDSQKLDKLYAAIISALESGVLPSSRLDDAALNVITLKLKRGIIDGDYLAENEQIENALKTVGSVEHRRIEREIAEAAVTLYGARHDSAALSQGDKVLFAVPYDNEANSVKFAVDRLIREGAIPRIELATYCYNKTEVMSVKLKNLIKNADRIVIISESSGATLKNPGHWINVMPKQILRSAKYAKKTNIAILSAGLPYDAVNFPDLPVYIVYGYVGMSESDAQTGVMTGKYGPNIPAGVGAALGAFAPSGVLPV